MSGQMRVAFGSFKDISQATVGSNYSGNAVVDNGAVVPDIPTTFPLIDLHMSASKLKDLDVLTKSDPICVLFLLQQNRWVEFARTEVVWNNLNPTWVKFFRVKHVFEIRQPLKFKIYDVDSENASLKDQDFIGEADVDLSAIVSNPQPTELGLHLPGHQESRGKLSIIPEQVQNCASVVSGKITALNLKKMHFFGANSAYFVLAKSSESGKWLPVLQSEISQVNRWRSFVVPIQVLTNLDFARPLRIAFFDRRGTSLPVEIGHHDTTFTAISESLGQSLSLVDDRGASTGVFRFDELSMEERFSFYDYLRTGTQVNLITAIDFTASNGDPRMSRSLHYINPGNVMNPYETCIQAVGEILGQYDSDQLFPVFGFGGQVNNRPNHCFELTFNPQAPYVQGLNGILGAYRNAITQVPLSGPTLFAPVIRRASTEADRAYRESRTYSILLIITDGVINDMPDTVDAIVDAGSLPLSIIIIGVGPADFGAMNALDADDHPLVSRQGKKMIRDIVQFVPFRKFEKEHYTVLASEVLAEVPTQFVQWANMHGIRPA
jgi:hypothetical protein